MLFTAIVIGTVLAIAYVWSSRGFFSALIHMLCVIVAGAIAFAAWEPLTQFIIGLDDSKDGSLVDLSFGLGLGVPFALSLVILRLSLDGIIRKNVDLDGISNWTGGAVCGLISGTITAGIFIMTVSSLRLESTIMGWGPITYNDTGSLVRTGRMIYPADHLTGWFYSVLSDSTFRTEQNLAKWHPEVADEGVLRRLSHDKGKARAVIRPDAYEVLASYSVKPGSDVLNDTFGTKKYSFTYVDGEQAIPGQTTLMGYVVRFKPAAYEKGGRVIVGNGQLRLVVEKQDGTSMGIQPIAVVSEAENVTPRLGRWPFDGQDSFIATFNARNEAPLAFEFPVPTGAKPLALYVKGQRTRLDVKGAAGSIGNFENIAARDRAINDRSITPASAVKQFETAGAFKSNPAKWPPEPPMRVSDGLPYGLVLQKDDTGGLTIEEGNRILSGEAKMRNDRLANRGIDPKLQVRRFAVPEDVLLIQVTVDGKNREFGFLSDPAGNVDRTSAPVLVDESGQQFPCVGYVYRSPSETWITYTPGAPVTSINDMPPITRSQPNDQMVLLFRVSLNAKVKYFVIGEKAIAEFDKVWDMTKR